MTGRITESVIEDVALDRLAELGYEIAHGSTLLDRGERSGPTEVVLLPRLTSALAKINPQCSPDIIDEAVRKLTRADVPGLLAQNRAIYKLCIEGIPVPHLTPDGPRTVNVQVFDWDRPHHNDWLAVNQLSVHEERHHRIPDIVLFVNGLPLVVIELKNAVSETADTYSAFTQLQTYREELSSLMSYNAWLIASDGATARAGTISSDWERFAPWRTTDGEDLAPRHHHELDVLIPGMCAPHRFLDLLQSFIVYEDDTRGSVIKKLAGYHQFHAVNRAVITTVRASTPDGDRKAGVIWHTQGSGKSLTMVFFTGKLIQATDMENPTIIVVTDRTDLDDQLFGTFARCSDLLRTPPEQATNGANLKERLQRASGGIIFTTLQKFWIDKKDSGKFPLLSSRRNIVVISDEAHRSQYDFIDGFAKNLRDALPNASFIGFTGTPLALTDKNTVNVFGDYIDVYDIQRAVEDEVTVPITYENRLVQLELKDSDSDLLDLQVDELLEGEEATLQEKYKSKWARLEALVGAAPRVTEIAGDIVRHFEQRQEAMLGKGMIVCMSRRICIALYEAIIALRPDWASTDAENGQIAVVMTGSASDPVGWQRHIGDKKRRETLAKRFKDPADELQLVLVCDMWLTGFDVPPLHTMYLDKPLRGHGLMQAIARVNRVFGDKPGGRIVDYLGIAANLKQALAVYTNSGGEMPQVDPEDAVRALQEKHEVLVALFHGCDLSAFRGLTAKQLYGRMTDLLDFLYGVPDGEKRFLEAYSAMQKAFALAVPHPDALALRDDMILFQSIKANLYKREGIQKRPAQVMDAALQQLVSGAVSSGGVIDIFDAAGLKKPDISILSEEFLLEVQNLPQRNLALELLRRLLNDDIKRREKRNVVQARLFSQLLESAIRGYQNRAIEAAEVIEKLIEMAKQLRDADLRSEQLGLTEDEVAFYDALGTSDSAVQLMEDETLRQIARELAETIRKNVTIDWTERESVQANLRRLVKRILTKYKYPPEKQETATDTVLEQAKVLCAEWAGG